MNTVYQSANSGEFIIIKNEGCNKITVRFVATGYERTVQMNKVKSGQIKDPYHPTVFNIGYLGIGDHVAYFKGKNTVKYNAWSGMLERCYCPKYHSKKPTYVGCTVHLEWHNFQTFGNWFDKNYIKGFQLDKDIKVKGNKIYSAETCRYISAYDNNRDAHVNKQIRIILAPDGKPHLVACIQDFADEHNLCKYNLAALLRGVRKTHKGWRLP